MVYDERRRALYDSSVKSRPLVIAAAASLAAYALVGYVVFDLNRSLRKAFR